MLIKQGSIDDSSKRGVTGGSPGKRAGLPGFDKFGLPKKENFKEYDLRTNKIVEVKKKVKVNYGSDSSGTGER